MQFEGLSVIYILGSGLFSVLCFCLNAAPLGWGRLSKGRLDVSVNPRVAWCLMELPSLLWTLYFLLRKRELDLLLLFGLHYLNRAVIYPCRLTSIRNTPIEILLSALLFNTCNGYLQGLAYLEGYPSSNPQKALGLALFLLGLILNIDCDERLRRLRKHTRTHGYKVPRGGLLDYVSSANYTGEILEWTGYAVACGNAYPLLFAAFTWAFLMTEGIKRARFNETQISGYPKGRWRVMPFIA